MKKTGRDIFSLAFAVVFLLQMLFLPMVGVKGAIETPFHLSTIQETTDEDEQTLVEDEQPREIQTHEPQINGPSTNETSIVEAPINKPPADEDSINEAPANNQDDQSKLTLGDGSPQPEQPPADTAPAPDPEPVRPVTIIYDVNGGEGDPPVDSNSPYAPGSNITLLAGEGLTRPNYQLIGWNTAPSGSEITYELNMPFTIGNEDITLYALWAYQEPTPEPGLEPALETFGVIYYGNSIEGEAPVEGVVPVDEGAYSLGATASVAGSGSLMKKGYLFNGWNTQPDGKGDTYYEGDPMTITGPISLYGLWVPQVKLLLEEADQTGETLGTVFRDEALKKFLIGTATKQNFTENTPIQEVVDYFSGSASGALNYDGKKGAGAYGMITDLTGLERLTFLHSIILNGHQLTDLTPITNLPNLIVLNLENNSLGNNGLATFNNVNLPQLNSLTLSNNGISDLTPLQLVSLPRLTALTLKNNVIADLRPLSGFTIMRNLDLVNNKLTDLTGLETMRDLYHLYVSNNQITSLEALRGITTMGQIQFTNNQIVDISPLEESKDIFNILLNKNRIVEVGPKMYDIVKNIGYFAWFQDQKTTLESQKNIDNTVVFENPVKLKGEYVKLTTLSNKGTQSADNSTLSWDFTGGGIIPVRVTLTFKEIINPDRPSSEGENLFSGTVTVPLTKGYTVSYNTNTDDPNLTGAAPTDDTIYDPSATVTVVDNPDNLARPDYAFKGWGLFEEATAIDAVEAFTIDKKTTLYAIWEKIGKYVITQTDGEEELYIDRTPYFQVATSIVSTTPGTNFTITLLENDEGDGTFPGAISTGKNVLLTSGPGGPFYIKNPRESTTANDAWYGNVVGTLRVKNIILDGNQKGSGLFIQGGTLILEDGAVIKNCVNILNGGAAVTVYNTGSTLIMNSGAQILNNHYRGDDSRGGGGIYAATNTTVTINGGVIKGNSAPNSFGGGILSQAALTIKGGEISGNIAGSYGGGIALGARSSCMITGGTIMGNSAKDGGGIYISQNLNNPSVVYDVSPVVLSNNTATNRGGGLFSYVSFNMNGTTFSENNALWGGGIYLAKEDGPTKTAGLKNTAITNNTATNGGGGIYSSFSLNITGGTISENITSGTGGGIDAREAVTITGTQFVTNQASEGGAVFLEHSQGPSTISGVTIKDNTAGFGGAIEVFKGTLNIENSTIDNNQATINGGGIFTNGAIAITECELTNNTAAKVGGAIDARAAALTLTNTLVEGNKALQGGGLYLRNNTEAVVTSQVNGATINQNTADHGGGVFLIGKVKLSAKGATVSNNRAVRDGGGIYTDDFDYNNPANLGAYQKIITDKATVFKGNIAEDGLYNPPSNAGEFAHIGFISTSVSGQNLINPDHLLNNYDINFKEDFTVTYDKNGADSGAVPEDGTIYTLNDLVTVMTNEGNLTRRGHTFMGWAFKKEGVQSDVITQFTISKDTTLYALWAINQYTATFNPMGGSDVPPQKENYNKPFTKPTDPVKVKFVFDGWYTESGLINQYNFDSLATKNIVLYAKWKEEVPFTVTYDGNGAQSGTALKDPNSPYYKGTTVTVLGQGSLLKTHHEFIGWNTQRDGRGTAYAEKAKFIMDSANIILYAQWEEEEKFTVTYHGNGGTGTLPIDADTYYLNQQANVLPPGNLNNPRYLFAGWNTQADGRGRDYIPGGKLIVTGNIHLYAQWQQEANRYQVTYLPNGGRGDAPVDSHTYAHGEMSSVLNQGSLYRRGYTFAGWNTQADGRGTPYGVGNLLNITGDTLLYAQWRNNGTGLIEVPQTGDSANTVLWIVLAGAALGAVILLVIIKSKKNKKK